MRGFCSGQMDGEAVCPELGLGEKTQDAEVKVITQLLSGVWGRERGEFRPQARTDFSSGFQSWRKVSGCSGGVARGSELPIAGRIQMEAVEIFRMLGRLAR